MIELWRGGRRVDGEEQVVQEGAGASPTTPTSRGATSTSHPVSTAAGAAAAPSTAFPPKSSSLLSLTRKGERTREFYFASSSRGGEDGGEGVAEAAREMSRRLRTETERERRSMLLDIFEAAHSRRRRWDSGRGRGGLMME